MGEAQRRRARPRHRPALPFHPGDGQGGGLPEVQVRDQENLGRRRPRLHPGRRRLGADLGPAARGPARRDDPLPRRRTGGDGRARADDRRLPRSRPLRLGHLPLDVPDGGVQARRVLHALARSGRRHPRARRGRAPLPRPRRDGGPKRAVRGPRRAARGATAIRTGAAAGGDGGRPGTDRGGLHPLLGRVQRLRRGRAHHALLRNRHRHHRPLGRLSHAQAGFQADTRRRRPAHHVRDSGLPHADRGEPLPRGSRPRGLRRIPREPSSAWSSTRRPFRASTSTSTSSRRSGTTATAAARWGSPRTPS